LEDDRNKVTNFFNVFLTVHLSITLVNDQFEAQLLYCIICLLQSSTCFEQCRAHHQEVRLFLLDLRTGVPLTESDYTGCCISTIWPPDDEHDIAWNM